MESINKTMQRLYQTPEFRKRYEDLKQEVLENHDIRAFLMENSDMITEQMIETGLMKLYEFTSQAKNCKDCPGLSACENIMQGYEPSLVIVNNRIDIHYRACPEKIIDDERRKTKKLIESFYMPKEILNASFADFSLDSEGRLDAFEYAERFSAEYEQGSSMKGLYLHGEFGVGKSYLLGAIANQLAQKGISSLIVYVPEFLREMKQSLGDQTLNEKLEAVKKAHVLMLDDIGAEAMSSWTRDEILGSIMQYRMHEQLPTFFTSNFDFSGLEYHLTYTQRGEEEKMKARRLMERIKYLSIPIKLGGPNRRHM
ncbi:primosomal protein DnaI [Siminovitchia acidinfaciens]|uniref:Primosomal protein DnaI n=1 Tax=Siminovitchia acidinfaciens TaxID=2321395 RepID=A0A429Y549_9BACI|nr:primosomal protein DnaI [Siminovitchia acidinfaciens]RST76562.1 primosomal protein DnaI [Siminovitchia acidinfaciens]VEF47355.1 Primosomal DnaI domain-containing protein [Bacillus freudenreichii]